MTTQTSDTAASLTSVTGSGSPAERIHAPGEHGPPRPHHGGRALRVILALIAIGLVAYGCVRESDAPVPSVSAAVSASAAAWYPNGFSVSSLDPTVAYRWMSKNQFRCDPAPRCWGLQVVAKDGCAADLTIELSVADSAGASLGTVFDTAGVVRAGQQATMVFEVVASGAQKAEISKVSCT